MWRQYVRVSFGESRAVVLPLRKSDALTRLLWLHTTSEVLDGSGLLV